MTALRAAQTRPIIPSASPDATARPGAAGAKPPGWGVRTVKIEPRLSPGRGRGVFAVAPIEAGELIERVCAAEIPPEQCTALDRMQPIGDYYFQHPENPDAGLMLFGLVSLSNHSDDPNAEVRRVFTPDLGWTAELVALKPIPEGAEVTHKYRCPPWFEVA